MNTMIRVTITTPEPPGGSVVMVNGPSGTAYQKHHSDGLFHSTTGVVKTWEEITALPREDTLIVYMGTDE